ncbi:MAG: hypothetical protein IMW99_10625, partial [Firmicutes bacterium]|nr:hypothetical protein [Bacillota bacterium]
MATMVTSERPSAELPQPAQLLFHRPLQGLARPGSGLGPRLAAKPVRDERGGAPVQVGVQAPHQVRAVQTRQGVGPA